MILTLQEELEAAARLCDEKGWFRAAARLRLVGRKRKKPEQIKVFVGKKATPGAAFRIEAKRIERATGTD